MTNIGLLKFYFKKDIFNLIVDYCFGKKHRRIITKKERERREKRHLIKLQKAYDERDRKIKFTEARIENYKKKLEDFNKLIYELSDKFIKMKSEYLNKPQKHYNGSKKTYIEKLNEFERNHNIIQYIQNKLDDKFQMKGNIYYGKLLRSQIIEYVIAYNYRSLTIEYSPLYDFYVRVKNSNKIKKLNLKKTITYNFKEV